MLVIRGVSLTYEKVRFQFRKEKHTFDSYKQT